MIPPAVLERDRKLFAPGVDETFRRKALAVLNDVRGHNLPIVVVEVLRSKARAALMKATGKSKNGMRSKHVTGRAFDCAFWNGKGITWDVPAEWWAVYGRAAEAHGLTWGGRWKMRDMNHVELS